MSGAVVVTPAAGAAWATAWEQFEGIRKGLISLSLTNYDAAAVPQIASGSWIEAVGSIYKWTGDDAIVGAPTNDVINYITMVPSGVGASAILTPTWSDSAPAWSDAYQGYYDGTTRYAAGCYYDGANYPLKWVYTNRHAGPITRYKPVSLTGITNNLAVCIVGGAYFRHQATAPTQSDGYFGFNFGDKPVLLTELRAWASGLTGIEEFDVTLWSSPNDETSTVNMATVTFTDGETEEADTTITNPVTDPENNEYFVSTVSEAGVAVDAYLRGIRIKYTEIIRC